MRVSATTLDSFRLWRQPEQEWMTEEMLLDSILRRSVSSPQMALGKAFGALIEAPDQYRVFGGYACEGHWFSDDAMAPVLKLYDRRGLFEVKGSRLYDDVLVVAKADQLLGAQLIETKTTKQFDFEKYAHAYQWRLMADIFEPLLITYHVFPVDAGDQPTLDGLIPVDVRDVQTFNLFPYAGLHADCAEIVRDFRAYVMARGLDAQLRDIQATAEVAA